MTQASESLPARVRARVVAYAADALASLPPEHVPGALKRAASFAPQRRARIAGEQIFEKVAVDDSFREHIAVQAKARQIEVADRLAEGAATVETAALAYLVRDDGWEALVATVAAEEQSSGNDGAQPGHELEALRGQLAAALTEQSAIRQAAKADLATARAEITHLRRKVGEARSQARNARSEAERLANDVADRSTHADSERAATEAENRRLKARLVEIEADLARAQRVARSTKVEGTIRARLLLDTLVQAGQGLRQELALPAVTGSPADQVGAHLAEEGHRSSSGATSMPLDDPAHVRDLLALPRMHLIVDGYNVTRAEWDGSTLEIQRKRLLAGLGPLAAQSGAEVTVVFDGTNAESRPVVQQPRGVRVLFSPRDVLADDVIRDLVAAEPEGRPVGVVTSDQEIVRDVVRKPGVRVVGSRALVRLLT
jgi:predicted RNA-binding protein with PIN domain